MLVSGRVLHQPEFWKVFCVFFGPAFFGQDFFCVVTLNPFGVQKKMECVKFAIKIKIHKETKIYESMCVYINISIYLSTSFWSINYPP